MPPAQQQQLGTCGCKVCKRSPLTSHALVRRQGEPASITTPADEASAEDEGEDEDEDEEGWKERGVAALFEAAGGRLNFHR